MSELFIIQAVRKPDTLSWYLAGTTPEFIPIWVTEPEGAMWFEKKTAFTVLNCIRLLEPTFTPTIVPV